MNLSLLKEIIMHIYANFAIVPSNFIDLTKTASLMEFNYLLKEKISFKVDSGEHHGKIWGCQMAVASKEIKIILADCSMEQGFQEFAMIVHPKDAPMYGLYLIYNDYLIEPKDYQPMIAISVNNGKDWMQINTNLQATFLAAMEQARDLQMTWKKIEDYSILYTGIMSFIKFHEGIYES